MPFDILSRDLDEQQAKFFADEVKKYDLVFFSVHGSALYGLATENSDHDYKGIYLPSPQDILLGKARESVHLGTKHGQGKNTEKDVDIELYSLGKFLSMCMEGQTATIDMLFSPREGALRTPLWDYIIDNRSCFVTKRLGRFIDYARNQARKYGFKGTRWSVATELLKLFRSFPPTDRVESVAFRAVELAKSLAPEKGETIVKVEEHRMNLLLDICGKKFPFRAESEVVVRTLERMLERYGDRTKTSGDAGGVDYKALSHAFRAIFQLRALVEHGKFSYPLKETDFLMSVKKGEIGYDVLEPLLEKGFDDAWTMLEASNLPDEPGEEANRLLRSILHTVSGKNRDRSVRREEPTNGEISR